MRSERSPTPACLAPAVAAAVLLLGACDGVQSTLEPDGPAAIAIAELWWVMLAVSAVVFIAMCALLLYALFRRRELKGDRPPLPLLPSAQREMARRLSGASQAREDENSEEKGGEADAEEPQRTESDDEPREVFLETAESDRRSVRWVIIGGVLIPAVILTGTLLYTLYTLGRLSDRGHTPDLTIEVTGWQWWWEVHYLDAEGRPLFETANEIHLPVGRRVRFRLKSADVIHSFWVPQLGGKLDMIPGRTTEFWLQANEPGIYRGQCAEYCDGPHAYMAFLTVVESPEEFAAWVAHQQQAALEPADALALRGREVFLTTACKACHTIRGTPAMGSVGPDLTHVASRRTLAAALLPNTRGHMGGWLGNPQALKPRAKMPAVPLENEEFTALLHYLQSLR